MLGSVGGNVLGTLYFVYFQIAGILIMARLLKKEGTLTKFLLGSVLGSVLLQWLPVLFAFVFDFAIISHVLAALALLPVFVMTILKRNTVKTGNVVKTGITDIAARIRYHGAFFVLLAITMILWIYLLNTHTIPMDETGAFRTGQCTYGDMNMHLGFVSSLAVQGTFPPEYSLYPGEKLAYPFLSDSISSGVYMMGASLRYAYILPMVVAFMQVIGGVYLLAVTLFGSRAKALLTYILYFFNGGLGFVYFIDWAREREFTLESVFSGYYTTPTNLVDHNIRWVNLIADMLLPQRATLFGYAVLFSAIWMLYKAVFHERKEYFLPVGILVSALPMIHTHSFLAVAFISAAWLLLYLCRGVVCEEKRRVPAGWILLVGVGLMCLMQSMVNKGKVQDWELLMIGVSGIGICVLCGVVLLVLFVKKNGWKNLLQTWGVYLGAVLVLALPQLLFWTFGQATGENADNFVRGHFNWGNQGDFYPWFYIKNLGLPLILIVAAICAKRKKSAELVLPAMVIWFVAEFIVFQPNVYDNNKLLYVAYLLLCLAAADYGVEWYRHLKEFGGAKWFAGLFLVLATLSAVLTLGREAVSDYQLYGASEVQMAQYVEEHTEPDAVILTYHNHNNAVASLTGRNIVCGADAFLYFHGYDTTERKADIRKMYEYPAENMDLFTKYEVSYVVVSGYERANYAVDEAKIKEMFELVFTQGDVQLYRVK